MSADNRLSYIKPTPNEFRIAIADSNGTVIAFLGPRKVFIGDTLTLQWKRTGDQGFTLVE